MEQLQVEIKKDIIEHATRNIEIIYEPNKTSLTKQDEQLLAAYIQLHDFELNLQKTLDGLFHECIPVRKMIELLEEERIKLQATFDVCCSLADKLGDTSYIFDETNLEKLTESQKETSNGILEYNGKLLKVYETIKDISSRVDIYNEASEDGLNAVYDEYSKIHLAHSINWENNSINIVAYENEYENFLNYRSVKEEHRRTLWDYCDSTINSYTNLNLQTTSLYNVWNEFVKRCNLLRATAELHTGALAISNN
jgi:hypothetical protein